MTMKTTRQSLFPIKDCQERRTHKCTRKSPAAWLQDVLVVHCSGQLSHTRSPVPLAWLYLSSKGDYDLSPLKLRPRSGTLIRLQVVSDFGAGNSAVNEIHACVQNTRVCTKFQGDAMRGEFSLPSVSSWEEIFPCVCILPVLPKLETTHNLHLCYHLWSS